MNVVAFANEIKKGNKTNTIRSIVMFMVFLLAVFMSSAGSSTFSMRTEILGIVLIVFLYGIEYWKSYLRIEDGGFGLCSIARTNAFDVKGYFSYIRKKQVIWNVVILIYMIVIGLLTKNYIYVFCSIGVAVLPLIIGFGKQFIFVYYTRNRVKTWISVVGGIASFFEVFAIFVVSLFYLVAGFLLGYTILSDLATGGLNDKEILYRSSGFSYLFGGLMIVWLLFAVSFLFSFRLACGKKKILIRSILGASVVILFVANIVLECNNYVEVGMDKITVATFEGRKVYSFDEIESYEIYDDDGIQVKLSFQDGNTAELIGKTSTISDAYDELYYSEYNFVADLLPEFEACGAKGKIRDVEELRDEVAGMDSELSVGLEEIVSFMDGER
jgi:hypothetical protein